MAEDKKQELSILALIEIGAKEHLQARRQLERKSLSTAIWHAFREQGPEWGLYGADVEDWQIKCVLPDPKMPRSRINRGLAALTGTPTVFVMHDILYQFVQNNEETEPDFYIALLSNFEAIAMTNEDAQRYLVDEEEDE